MNERAVPLLLLAACGFVSSCGASETEDKRRLLLQQWGDGVLLPAYRSLEGRTLALVQESGALCEVPSATTLEQARDAWWNAREPLKRAEVFALGPYKEWPLRLGPKLDFWPVRPDAVLALLTGSEPLTPDVTNMLGAAAKGFPAIEYLLYESEDPLTFEDTRRCEVLEALTVDLTARSTDLLAAWDPAEGAYLNQFVYAGRDGSAYSSLQMAMGEVVNRMGFTIENIRSDKLGKVLGRDAGKTPEPDEAESQYSGRSIEDIRNNLQGIEELYFGNSLTRGEGLDSYLQKRQRYFTLGMRERIDACYQALDEIKVPLTQAVMNTPEVVERAVTALTELQTFIQVDVANALSLTVGFNDNDGD